MTMIAVMIAHDDDDDDDDEAPFDSQYSTISLGDIRQIDDLHDYYDSYLQKDNSNDDDG